MKRLDYHSHRKFAAAFFFAVIFITALLSVQSIQAQSRVHYRGKDIFLSGINAAWVNFAADFGPSAPNLDQFRTEFQTVRNNGGNAMRLWMFINGVNAPEYNSNGFVTGPGPVSIQNLKQILSLAHHYNVGLILSLWSFDMLQNSEMDSAKLSANQKMLSDTAYTAAFIRNALIPLVNSVKGDSAIIAWEVINEANGMTVGMNYTDKVKQPVPTSVVQRFTNLIAGAIHRTDSNAFVTTGPGSFQTLTDINPIGKRSEQQAVSALSADQLQSITNGFNVAHRWNLTPQQMKEYLEKIALIPNSNIYRDDRLISIGGDSLGTLDFYTVHYYASGSTALSPFSHPLSYFGLTKPTVVAEFYMQQTDGIPVTTLYPVLYQGGYAGALAWSWTDFPKTPNNPANAANDTWSTLQYMRSTYGRDINVFGTDYPSISIVSPLDKSTFQDSTQLTITAAVIDTVSSITSVKFFAIDSLLGETTTASKTSSDTLFYTFVWKNIRPGNYTLTALAENNMGQQEISTMVQITFGSTSMTRLEAEKATVYGTGVTVKKDPTASSGSFLDIQSNDTTVTVTWQFVNNSTAGNYPIAFGYKLNYQSPKSQYININGVRSDTVVFDGATSPWLEKTINANLVQGTNTVQMQLFWGWMYVDYLAVPNSIITSVEASKEIPNTYSLSQNYPNPFNPVTIINYSLVASGKVTLKVYDILGREVKNLVNEEKPAGKYEVEFNASNLASGIYFYTLRAGSFVMTKKMVLLK